MPSRSMRRGKPAAPSAPVLDFDIETLVTEDDAPVDNMPSEKQQRLLTDPLYSSWSGPGAGRTFLAAANVGVFPEPRNPAIVPDVFVSLDVQVAENWWDKSAPVVLRVGVRQAARIWWWRWCRTRKATRWVGSGSGTRGWELGTT